MLRADSKLHRRFSTAAARAAVVASATLALLCGGMAQAGLQNISDADLSSVHARDGFAFNLRGFSLDGSLTLRLGSSSDASGLSLGNISLSRSDDPANTFSDPYQLSISQRGAGLPDKLTLSGPLNSLGLLRWQFAADLSLQDAAASNFQAGALLLQDLRSSGLSLDLAPNADPDVQGIAFGLSLKLDLGALSLRPRGRSDTTLLDAPGAPEQFSLRGLHLGAANSTATGLSGAAWRLADLDQQPLLLNTLAAPDGSGGVIHLNLAWPSAAQPAPVGSMIIDNISFKSDIGGNVDLGSSRIGGMQIQYLDIKLKGGR
nr:hypothetical protein [uncultured Roseateles sp.]